MILNDWPAVTSDGATMPSNAEAAVVRAARAKAHRWVKATMLAIRYCCSLLAKVVCEKKSGYLVEVNKQKAAARRRSDSERLEAQANDFTRRNRSKKFSRKTANGKQTHGDWSGIKSDTEHERATD